MRLFSFQFLNKKVFWVALTGAFFVSLIYGLPHILISQRLAFEGKVYHPVTFFSDIDEAQTYAPQVEEVSGGKIFYGDVVLSEYADKNSPIQPLGGIVLGFMAKAVGLENTFILIDFIFPAALFVLFFAIVFLLTESILISFPLSLIYIFSRDASSLFPFSNFHQFKVFAAYFKPIISWPVETRLSFDRILAPEWTFVPLSLFLLFWILALKKENKFLAVAAGIFYGSLFYSYLYDWIVISLVLGFSAFISILAEDRVLRKVSWWALGTGFLISVPFWFSFFDLKALPHYSEIVARSGIEAGHAFRTGLGWHYAVWFFSGLVLWKLGQKTIFYAASALFAASIFSMNIQLLTGFVPQPDHFLRYPLALVLWPAYIILGILFWEKYGGRLLFLKKYALGFLFVAAILVVARNVQLPFAYAKYNYSRYTMNESDYASFQWIKENLRPNSVVLSPSVITNTHLLIFTPARVFVPPSGLITIAPDSELLERYIIAAKLFGVKDAKIKELFSRAFLNSRRDGQNENVEDSAAVYLFHYGLYSQEPDAYMQGQSIRELGDIEKTVVAVIGEWNNNPENLLNKYALEYVYVGSQEKKIFNFSANDFPRCLSLIHTEGTTDIYKFCP